MKTSKKHICFECFQNPKNFKNFTDEERKKVHVDIPMGKLADTAAEKFSMMIVEDMFPEIWSEKKEDFREFSKKDLAKEMFGAGVYFGVQAFMDSINEMNEIEKTIKNKAKH